MKITQETTACCPVCGEEKIRSDRAMREYEAGVIVRERSCTNCPTEWQTVEKFVKVIRANVNG